jgi:hypothetical protein
MSHKNSVCCHGMVPMLQCIDTMTIRALRRPVSKEVWDNNSACCMSNIPLVPQNERPGPNTEEAFRQVWHVSCMG